MNLRLPIKLTLLLTLFAATSCQIEGAPGCESDDDCRSGRVCVDGECAFSNGAPRDGSQTGPDLGSRVDESAPDEHPAIDAPPAIDETPPDVPLDPFCQGRPQVSLSRQLISPVGVTGEYTPLRSCCEDLNLRFHMAADLGFDLLLTVGWFVGTEIRQVDLGDLPEGIQVGLCRDESCEDLSLSGSLDIVFDDERGAAVSICAQVEQPYHELYGARLAARDVYVAPLSWGGRFGMWLLADPDLTGTEAYSLSMQDLQLGQPILDLTGAAFYDSETLELGLSQSSGALFDRLPPVGEHGVPFVVTADDERIFQGAFWTGESDTCPERVAIYVEPPRDDRVIVHWGCSSPPQDDPRLDPRLLDVFREAGKLID